MVEAGPGPDSNNGQWTAQCTSCMTTGNPLNVVSPLAKQVPFCEYFCKLSQKFMATLTALGKDWPWDQKHRCKSMLNNEILSDVKFVVKASRNFGQGDSKRSKVVIPAHKILLSICSPVFYAMFCGNMAETKEHIDLPDCGFEGMLELLRYIYTDEVHLNGNNVMEVLYLAEKYLIPSLASECTDYLGRNLDFSNLFCVLQHAQRYKNKDLLRSCWDLIDNETEKALKSSEFMTVERSFVKQLVKRETLNVKEVELFKAIDCWAKKECKRRKLKIAGSVKRQVLGEQIVKQIRFPIMTQNEFMDVVIKSKILTPEETSMMMNYFNGTIPSAVGFLHDHRLGPLLRCCRFLGFNRHQYIDTEPGIEESLPLTVDKDIMLHGVSLLGNDGSKFAVTVKVSFFPPPVDDEDDDDDSDDDSDDEIVVASTSGTYISGRRDSAQGFYYGFHVKFDEPVALDKGLLYFITVTVDGPSHCVGGPNSNLVGISGVEFNFNPIMDKDPPDNTCAELLFKVTE